MLFGKSKIFKRFENIYNQINGSTCTFDTKLGKRTISICYTKNNNMYFTYFDEGESDSNSNKPDVLFMLHIFKNGKINFVTSKIDEVAIFSAIFELESILFKNQLKVWDRGQLLAMLLRWYL